MTSLDISTGDGWRCGLLLIHLVSPFVSQCNSYLLSSFPVPAPPLKCLHREESIWISGPQQQMVWWGRGIASYINNNSQAQTELKTGCAARNISKETSGLVNIRRNMLYIECWRVHSHFPGWLTVHGWGSSRTWCIILQSKSFSRVHRES